MMKIRWGVLGDAGIARNFVIPGMQAGTYSEIYAIASRDIKKAQKTPKTELELAKRRKRQYELNM